MKEHKIFKFIWEYMTLIIGGILCGISISFLLPAKLTTGGFSGIATIIYFLTEFPVETGLILLNIPAFLITGKVIGVKYSVRSFVGMMFSSVGVVIGEMLPVLTTDVMLAAIYGGLLSGLGMALTYRAGGSTGGTDLIARLLHEKKQHINIGDILLIVDGIIIAEIDTLKNAFSPIVCKDVGNVIDVNLTHPLNAFDPIVVIELCNVTEFNKIAPLNAFDPIFDVVVTLTILI